MMFAAKPIGDFVDQNPTLKILALAFLIMVGMALIAEGFDLHISKGYIYTAMVFSVFIELINMAQRRKARPVQLRNPYSEGDERHELTRPRGGRRARRTRHRDLTAVGRALPHDGIGSDPCPARSARRAHPRLREGTELTRRFRALGRARGRSRRGEGRARWKRRVPGRRGRSVHALSWTPEGAVFCDRSPPRRDRSRPKWRPKPGGRRQLQAPGAATPGTDSRQWRYREAPLDVRSGASGLAASYLGPASPFRSPKGT